VATAELFSPKPGFANLTRITTDGVPTLSLAVAKATSNPYDLTLRAYSDEPAAGSDVLLATVEIRLVPSAQPANSWALLSTSFQQAVAPFRGNLDAGLNVTSEWQRFSLPFQAKKGGPAGALRWHFVLGSLGPSHWQLRAGSIVGWAASANVSATSLPVCCNFGYDGRSPDAAWRKDALANAAKIRRGSLAVRVVDSSTGKLVSSAAVRVDQLAHTFRHGTAVDASVISMAARGAHLGPDDAKYIEVLESGLFQTAVFEGGMKWPSWQQPSLRNRTLASYAWLKAAGYYVRMHNLVRPPPSLSTTACLGIRAA